MRYLPFGSAGGGSFLPEDQVEGPAAADVRTGAAAVVEQVAAIAAGLFEGVGEDRQAVEGALLVYRTRQRPHVGSAPGRVERGRAERVAEDIPQQIALNLQLFAGG